MAQGSICPQRNRFWYRLAVMAVVAVSIVGCGLNEDRATHLETGDDSLPVVSGSGLEQYLSASTLPVLVEFGVDFNCPRCAQTKSDIVALRETLKDHVDVIRVDFNSNAQTVAKLGGTICPTYVLFDSGTHVLTRSFPVSIDLLEGDVLRQLVR